jgi:hypothetical protein
MLVLLLLVGLLPASARAQLAPVYYVVWDDFHDGFTADAPGAKWFHFSAGHLGEPPAFFGNDGVETTSALGLRVVPSGTNPTSGEPAFTLTMAQEDDNPLALFGQLDHVKWLVYMNHTASSGFPGFDAAPGREVSCEAWISGRTYGTAGHPFGSNVADANDDPRLAALGIGAIDFETSMSFDFALTNRRIYALYQRLLFDAPAVERDAVFTFQIPIADRTTAAAHRLAVAYDRSAGIVRWLVDNREVFRVTRIGRHIDRAFMTLDHGGTERDVAPRQLDCGMGLSTLIDGYRPTNIGLARLSNLPYFYHDPAVGPPTPQPFVDNESFEASRLFGQGAEIGVTRYTVSSLPTILRALR